MASKKSKSGKGSRKSKQTKSQAKKKSSKRGPEKKRRITRKDASQYPGLNEKYFSRIKQEYYDIDYINKLSSEEKEWLSSFMEEDLGARFNHKGKKIYKKKSKKRESYDRNNARNRDIYSIAKATGKISDVSTEEAVSVWEDNYVNENYEDILIEELDKKNKKD